MGYERSQLYDCLLYTSYLIHEAPADEQNFAMVMEMIAAAEVREDDADYQSPLDILFERLEMREPDSIACKQYRIFKQAAGKTCLLYTSYAGSCGGYDHCTGRSYGLPADHDRSKESRYSDVTV